MFRRDAAENADLRASSVMLTACLGSEPGTLRESGNCCRNLPWMRPCPCVSAEGRRHGGTGRERARKSDPRVKNGSFLTQYASHFPHLGLKLGYNYTPTVLLYSWFVGAVWTLVTLSDAAPTCNFEMRSDMRTAFCFAKHIFILVIWFCFRLHHLNVFKISSSLPTTINFLPKMGLSLTGGGPSRHSQTSAEIKSGLFPAGCARNTFAGRSISGALIRCPNQLLRTNQRMNPILTALYNFLVILTWETSTGKDCFMSSYWGLKFCWQSFSDSWITLLMVVVLQHSSMKADKNPVGSSQIGRLHVYK